MDGSNQPNNSDGSWRFTPDGDQQTAVQNSLLQPGQPEIVTPSSVASPPTGAGGTITWTASEFIAHQKNQGWYGLLAVGAVVAAAAVWLLTRDTISSLFILFAAGAFGAIAARQPRELTYRLDDTGLTIGPKHLEYNTFRSFAVMHEGAFPCIALMPIKRFGQLITVYYDPNDEAKIVDVLSDRLPLEERRSDPVDRLMWRIRF